MNIGTINFIEVNDGRITNFKSAIEKQQFIQTHPDAEVVTNHAYEPLYMLIDTDGTGWCLTPRHAVTYNEALDIINRYL